MNVRRRIIYFASAVVLLASCKGGKEKSSATGWNYNDPKMGGFEVAKEKAQKTGPNLVFVEGGAFTMGATEQDVTYEYNNIPRKVTVNSFFMDETEVANVHYREYIYWTERVVVNIQKYCVLFFPILCVGEMNWHIMSLM